MSYQSKEWKDMIVQYPTRYKIIHADQTQEVVTIVNDFGNVTQEGDVFDAQTFNDLEGRINDAVISTIFGTLDPTSAVGKNGDIYLKTSAGSITAVYAKVDNTWLALPTGGGGGATVYVGTTDPTSDIGENGNLYAKYHTDVTPVVDAFYVKISGSWASVSTGSGGLVGLELTQAQYDELTPEEKMNGTVYFITDSSIPSVLDDYQTKEDDGLETTSQEIVGAINELNSSLNALFVTRKITIIADSTAQYRDKWYGTASFDTPAGYTPFMWCIASTTGNHPATCHPSDSTHIRVFTTDQNDSVAVNVLYIKN